jgi:RNA polymerase sigma-70 factor (family 1)
MIDYKALSDAELIAMLKADDHAAFTEIYDRYFWLLHSHAHKWLRNREETKDIIHELFSQLWAKRETISFANGLAPYLYASVRNRVFNHLSKKRNADTYISSLESFLEKGECITDHLIRERQLMELIEAGMAEMPRKMRQVFKMSRKQHLSHREIAEQLDISEETVKKHIHHALKILRPHIKIYILALMLIQR